MRILLLADIHSNLTALRAVLEDADKKSFDKIAFLGDLIDYGMRPNETVALIRQLELKLCCSLWGNHERALFANETDRFASQRGVDCSVFTKKNLTVETIEYLQRMSRNGFYDWEAEGCRCLFIHGSLQDPFWKEIAPGMQGEGYRAYDFVFSGHSHRPHFFENYYEVDCPAMRNRKKTVFINPGSVGQPRNHNKRAQYGIFDTKTESMEFCAVSYDIEAEQSLYTEEIHSFYKERLARGI